PPPADPCLNGGHWTGLGCRCPPNLEGDRCQFAAATINVTAALAQSLRLVARVTNRDFVEAMGDPSSCPHRSFVQEFRRSVDRSYRNVPGYRGIQVLGLRRGSVMVDYEVLLHPLPGEGPSPTPGHRVQELLEASKVAQPHNCSDLGGPSPTGGPVADPGGDPAELCRRLTPANFSRFYRPQRVGGSLLCVTGCTPSLPGSIDCHGG
ncbi:MUC3A protein, partial [Rhinopomastus cyanomelas]|nr:MUC3A protein [Rhinopomastus cyanomelas]